MSAILSGGRYCLICGRASFLTVHRRCSRKIAAARARGLHSALAGRGQQQGPNPPRSAAVPASSSKVAAGGSTREGELASRDVRDAPAALSSRLPVGSGQGASCPQAAAMPPALLGLDRALSSGREPTTRSDAPSGARAHP